MNIEPELRAGLGKDIVAFANISTFSSSEGPSLQRWKDIAYDIADKYDAMLIDPQSGETLRK